LDFALYHFCTIANIDKKLLGYSKAIGVTSVRQQTSLRFDLQDIDQLILKGYQLSWKQFSPNWHPNIGVWCEEHSSRPASEQTAIMLSGIIEYADEYRQGFITPEEKAEILVGVGFILDSKRDTPKPESDMINYTL